MAPVGCPSAPRSGGGASRAGSGFRPPSELLPHPFSERPRRSLGQLAVSVAATLPPRTVLRSEGPRPHVSVFMRLISGFYSPSPRIGEQPLERESLLGPQPEGFSGTLWSLPWSLTARPCAHWCPSRRKAAGRIRRKHRGPGPLTPLCRDRVVWNSRLLRPHRPPKPAVPHPVVCAHPQEAPLA